MATKIIKALVTLMSVAFLLETTVGAKIGGFNYPTRPKFSFGRFQPMIDAIFSKSPKLHFRRPPPPPSQKPQKPYNPIAKPPPNPVLKPPYHQNEPEIHVTQSKPTYERPLPVPPPPPPQFLYHHNSQDSFEDGFGTPRPDSVLRGPSAHDGGSLRSSTFDLKPVVTNSINLEPIHETIHQNPRFASLPDQPPPHVQPQMSFTSHSQLENPREVIDHHEEMRGPQNHPSPMIFLNHAEENSGTVIEALGDDQALFNPDPLKSDTIILSQPNIGFNSNDDIIMGMRPPPVVSGNENVNLDDFPNPTSHQSLNFSPISQPLINHQDNSLTEQNSPLDLNDINSVFVNAVPSLNAGILPLQNEKPDELQNFPPFR